MKTVVEFSKIGHDLQPDPANVRPYLSPKLKFVIWGFYIFSTLLIVWGVYFKIRTVDLSKHLAELRSQESAVSLKKIDVARRAASLSSLVSAADDIRKWDSLNRRMQRIYMDVLSVLDDRILLSEFVVKRSLSQPQVEMGISFMGEQTQAALQFNKISGALVDKGYRLVSVDQRSFSGGVTYTTLFYYPEN